MEQYYVPNVTAGNLTHVCRNETWVNETTICFNFTEMIISSVRRVRVDASGPVPGYVTRYCEPNVTIHPHWGSAEILSLNLSSTTNTSDENGGGRFARTIRMTARGFAYFATTRLCGTGSS